MAIGESFANVLGGLTNFGRLELERDLQPFRIKSIQSTIDDLTESTRMFKLINDEIEKGLREGDDVLSSLEAATTPRERIEALSLALGAPVGADAYAGLTAGIAEGAVSGLPLTARGQTTGGFIRDPRPGEPYRVRPQFDPGTEAMIATLGAGSLNPPFAVNGIGGVPRLPPALEGIGIREMIERVRLRSPFGSFGATRPAFADPDLQDLRAFLRGQ